MRTVAGSNCTIRKEVPMSKRATGGRKITRRQLLKGAVATAAAVAGSRVSGVPTVWAQNIKDIKLVQAGGSYSAIIDIGRQATKDLGFQVEMQTGAHDALLNRFVTQPNSVDIADMEYFFLYQLVPRGVLHSIDLKKYKWWDKVVPIFTKGEYPDGRKVSRQGTLPYKVQYVDGPDSNRFAKGPTQWATAIPTVYNADTLGIRPDLVKRPIEHWHELLNPEFKGRAASMMPVEGTSRIAGRPLDSGFRGRWQGSVRRVTRLGPMANRAAVDDERTA